MNVLLDTGQKMGGDKDTKLSKLSVYARQVEVGFFFAKLYTAITLIFFALQDDSIH